MNLTKLIEKKEAEKAAKATDLCPALEALHAAIPSLVIKETKGGEKFLALDMTFQGSELFSPFFLMAYAVKNLPEDEILAAEEANLFAAVNPKVITWDRGAMTVSFFSKEEEDEKEKKNEGDNATSGRRGRGGRGR
jgi:hypothetical protein